MAQDPNEGEQKREIARLKRQGKSPAEAARMAKKKFPLSGKKGKKNRQGGADDPGRGGGRSGGRYTDGQSSSFGF